MRNVNLFALSLLTIVSLGWETASAKSAAPSGRPWMKCVIQSAGQSAVQSAGQNTGQSAVQSAGQSSGVPQGSAPAPVSPSGNGVQGQAIGMIFTIEPNNGNEISADILLLNSQGQVVKQVGHAEVLSSSTASVSLQQGPDSPFPFSMSLTPSSGSSFIGTKGFVSGTVSNVGLFGGQSLPQGPVQCRMYGAALGTSSGAPSGGNPAAPTGNGNPTGVSSGNPGAPSALN